MSATLKLGVNVDHVATVRQARGTGYPDPVEAARLCMEAGAFSITMHLREDRRHIQDRDVRAVRGLTRTPCSKVSVPVRRQAGLSTISLHASWLKIFLRAFM